MKTRNPFTNALALIALAAGLALIMAAFQTRRVQAIQDSEDRPSPLSIAFGQTLQINVANVSSGDPIPTEIVILDDSGNPLKRSRELVRPLHTAVLTLSRDEIGGREASRLLTRAVVKVIGNPEVAIRNLVISEEVIDNESQKTVLLHPGFSKGFNPQPDPPGTP